MALNVYEIFEQLCKPRIPTQVPIGVNLRAMGDNPVIKGLLYMNFSPTFPGFDLPEGAPNFKKDLKQPYGYAETQLHTEYKRLYLFLNGFVTLNQNAKIVRFEGLLEALHFREAELLVAIKDRKLTELFPMIDENLIRDVFPDILPPLTEKDGLIAAVTRGGDGVNFPWAVYTVEELEHLRLTKKITFKYPEHAKLMGCAHMLPDYVKPVEPPKVYSEDEYLNYSTKKALFGETTITEYHIALSDANIVEQLADAAKDKSAKFTFANAEQAKLLGVWEHDCRAKAAAKRVATKAKNARTEAAAKRVKK